MQVFEQMALLNSLVEIGYCSSIVMLLEKQCKIIAKNVKSQIF